MVISGRTVLIPHLGWPTDAFKAPMIYNPWFEKAGVDAVVVPMGVKSGDYPAVLSALARLTNVRGALVTMPHKVTTMSLVAEASKAAQIAGAANALLRREDGSWLADQFDGAAFVRGLARKGVRVAGRRAIVFGSGGVGSAIAASLASADAAELMLFDVDPGAAAALRCRLREHWPRLAVRTGSADPAGYDLVVNATPLGMKEGDALPFDVDRIAPSSFVGDVVLGVETTPLLVAAAAKGCAIQRGIDMLFEMIPAYLEFFGLPVAQPDELRALATIRY